MRSRYEATPGGSTRPPGAPGPERPSTGDGTGEGPDLKVLLGRLNRDATQLLHDELELAKLELRDIASAFSTDIEAAGQTLALNMAKIGVALTLGALAALALTTGAILAVGQLLGGAFWAGGFIVGAVLLIAAAVFGMSAARDLRESEALRLEGGRATLKRDTAVLRDEVRETKQFAREEAKEFKENATPPEGPRH